MNLDKVKQKTTWNDASGSINSNFEKIRQAILSILQGGGGSANIDVDTAMSDTSENAVANKVIKKYVDDADNALSERINALEQNGGGESSEGSLKTYVFYLDEELTEEKIEANKSFYEAAISEIPASYVVSSYGAIAIPTMVAGGQDSVIIGITTNDEIADSEARDREYLDVRNLQIELVEDGTFTIYKQFDSRLAKVRMLDEVIAKVDEIPDIVANLPQGEKFYYVHIPFEDAPLDEEQLAENAASCTKWLEAHKNNEPLPILCWAEFPNGEGRINVYGPSDGLLNFSISMTLGVGNDESLDNAEVVAMFIVAGTLASSGEVELYMPLEEKILTTINSFKTINGQSILGEGDLIIQEGSGGAEVRTLFVNDAGLTSDELSYNAETVQLIFAQHPMIFFASAEEGTPLSEYDLMGMDNGRMVFARYELDEYSTEATYIYLAMDGLTEVGGFNKSDLDGDKYDSSLDADSTNAVQNKVVTENIRALEAAMPLMAVIDLDTIIAQDTPIDNATRNALLELGGYTSGDKYFSKGWLWSRGYLYTIKVIPTDAGVQIHVLSLKGWTEIAEDNSKVNHLPSQGGGSIEVDAELSETSDNAVSNKAVTMALAETEEVTAAALNELNERFEEYATKEELEDALADVSIEVDSAMSDTSENAVSNKVIKKYVDDADKSVKKYVDDADNALSERISVLEQNSGGGASVEVDAELSESSTNAIANKAVTEAIIEDEEVVAVALNELNERVSNAATKEELAETLAAEIQNAKDVIDASIIDNEEVAAAALVDLDKRLKDILTILGNAGLI